MNAPKVTTSGDGLLVSATSTEAAGGTLSAGITDNGKVGGSYSASSEKVNPDGSTTVNHASAVAGIGLNGKVSATASASTVTTTDYGNGLTLRTGLSATVPYGSSPTLVAGIRGDYSQPTLSPYFSATAAITNGKMIGTLGVGACTPVTTPSLPVPGTSMTIPSVQRDVCVGVTQNTEGQTRVQVGFKATF